MGKNEQQKARVRERYKGINREELEVIPAIKVASIFDDTAEKRVAVYARVSTDDLNQTSSYELQKNYYQDMVNRNPQWKLVDIYADEGISGTSLNHRNAFVQMIEDCENGKIDLIITKSVPRFARNTLDCIGYIRKLAALPQPVGILFETENMYTLDPKSEMTITFLATLAQEESHTKSDIINASIEMRFSRGIFLTPALLGYDVDEDGNLTINEDEAMTVRLCFFMYLYGYNCQQIAQTLMQLGRKTKRGKTRWTPGTVLSVLQNERHCGDIIARKTYTPNYLDHKSKKNRQNRNQYIKKNHHEGIITRDDFIATQRLITNSKYGYKGLLPSLHVIDSGALCGFVEINPRWSGFSREDYLDAVQSFGDVHPLPSVSFREKEVQAGEFDLRGYEIVRSQFFRSCHDISVTFSPSELLFSKQCVLKLHNTATVELLFDPIHHRLAVRPTDKDNRHGVVWAKVYQHKSICKPIRGSAFLPTIFEILGWKPENKYRIRGVRRQKGQEVVLLFDLCETVISLPIHSAGESEDSVDMSAVLSAQGIQPLASSSAKRLTAFPEEWAYSFGRDVYYHEQSPELAAIDRDGQWDVLHKGSPYTKGKDVNPSSTDDLQLGIESILTTINQETTLNG